MAEKGLFIEALPRDGVVTFLALVKEKELRQKRTGGWYLYLLLSDRTGELQAKAWDQPEQTAAVRARRHRESAGRARALQRPSPTDRATHPAVRGGGVPGHGLLPGLCSRSRGDVPRAARLRPLRWKRVRSISIAVGPE